MGLPAFRPSRHGFPFANEFDYPGHLLGRSAAVCAPFGLSAGFCWAALDRYLAERRIARPLEAPKQEEPLFLELLQRQTNAIMSMGWDKALRWQRLPDEARGGAVGLAEMTRLESRWVRRSLDAHTPIMLYLVRAGSAFDSPFENQFVLAYRYEVDRGNDRLILWVYDPNRPDNDEVRLTLRSGPRRAALEGHLAVKDDVRGFFAVAYDREIPPALVVEEARGREGAIVLAEPPSVRLGRGSRVEAIARGEHGRLLALHRSSSGSWRAEEIDARGGIPEQLRPAVTPVLVPRGGLRAFGRAVGGDLVEYHRGPFGWKARSVTARCDPAHGYTIDSQPVVLGTGTGFALFARHGGDAVYFQTHGNGWRAENLSVRAKLAGPHTLTGELVAARGPDGTRHVFGRTEEGHLLHFRWRKDQGWASQSVTTNLERFGIAGGLVVLDAPDERALHVLARNAAGVPLDFRWSADSGWRARAMGDGGDEAIACDPSAAVGPDGTLHAVARGLKGQLLHFWSHGELLWRAQDVTGSHPALGDKFGMDGDPRLAAGPGEWLHVFARRGEDLLVYRWSPDADWTAESLGHDRERKAALASDPIVELSRDGAAHAFGVGVHGALLYLRSSTGDDLNWSDTRARGLAALYALTDVLALPGRWASRAFGGARPARRPTGPGPKAAHTAAGQGPRATTRPAPSRRTTPTNPDDEFAGAVGHGAPTGAPDPFATDTLPRSWGTVERAETPPAPTGRAPAPIEPPSITIPAGTLDASDLGAAAAPAPAGPVPPEPSPVPPAIPLAAAEMQRALDSWQPMLPKDPSLAPRPAAGGMSEIKSISLDPAFIGWDPTAPREPASAPEESLASAPPPTEAPTPPPEDGTIPGLILEATPPEPTSAPLAAERGFDFFEGATTPDSHGHAAPSAWTGAGEPSSEDLWGPPKEAEPKGPRPWEALDTPPAGKPAASASPAPPQDPAFSGPWAPPPELPEEAFATVPAPEAGPAASSADGVPGFVPEEPGGPIESAVPEVLAQATASPEPPATPAEVGSARAAAAATAPIAEAAAPPVEAKAPAETDASVTESPPPGETRAAEPPPLEEVAVAASASAPEALEADGPSVPAEESGTEAAAAPLEESEAEVAASPPEEIEAEAAAPPAEATEAEPIAAAEAEELPESATPKEVEAEPIAVSAAEELPEPAAPEEPDAEHAAPADEGEAEELVLPASFGARPAWLAREPEASEPPAEEPAPQAPEPAGADASELTLPPSFGRRRHGGAEPDAEVAPPAPPDRAEASGSEPALDVALFEAGSPEEAALTGDAAGGVSPETEEGPGAIVPDAGLDPELALPAAAESEPEPTAEGDLDVTLGESLPREEPLSQPGSDVADLTLTPRFRREADGAAPPDRRPGPRPAQPSGAAAEGSPAPLFDLSDLHLPETPQQQADAARDAALGAAAAAAGAGGGAPAEDDLTLTPRFSRRRRGRKGGPSAGHGKNAAPGDALLDTVDAIIAEAYSTRAQPQGQGKAGEKGKGAGFPEIQALPDYLILVPEGSQPPGTESTAAGGGRGAQAPATGEPPAANGAAPEKAATQEATSADAPPPAPVSAAPPAAHRGVRRRASRREAALDGLPLLEDFHPHGEPLPGPAAPAQPAPAAPPAPTAPAAAPASASPPADGKGAMAPGRAARIRSGSTSEHNGYMSEREIVLSGLPLLEPPDESAPPAPKKQ